MLDIAEQLFSEHGYDAVSVRDITDTADTRLASVNYHFKSKENLFLEVIVRRADALSDARLNALQAISDDISDPEERVSLVVQAFIRPVLEKSTTGGPGWKNYCRLVAQVATMRQRTKIVSTVTNSFNPAALKFVAALHNALPQLDDRLAHYSFQYMLGATLYIFTENGRLTAMSNKRYGSSELEILSDNLITFVTGGILALASQKH